MVGSITGCDPCEGYAPIAPDRTAQVVVNAGLAFMQNPRRGHYELAIETPRRRVAAAFTELAQAI